MSRISGFAPMRTPPAALARAAKIAVEVSLKVRNGEDALIVSNPEPDTAAIAEALYDALLAAGGQPALLYQPVKTQMEFAEPAVIAAFSAKPKVFISISAEKLGKDRAGFASPYEYKGSKWDHIFHLQLYGEKTCRAFWSPSVTCESFIRTVPIDYDLLKRRCAAIKNVLDNAAEVRVTSPGGADVRVGLKGRKAYSDDGDFSAPGRGGNLPAGESFISPETGASRGVIVFDGSISLHDGDMVIKDPIRCVLEEGFITEISGGKEAADLRRTIELAEFNAGEYERLGQIPPGMGKVYARNAGNLGELGIGLNPAAIISGRMLEDEKAFHTCHFAIGRNYDNDAPALIHLDGLVKNPTIIAVAENGGETVIEKDGNMVDEIR
jgi:leucyl aminopeptidase (aminopeptidase T)